MGDEPLTDFEQAAKDFFASAIEPEEPNEEGEGEPEVPEEGELQEAPNSDADEPPAGDEQHTEPPQPIEDSLPPEQIAAYKRFDEMLKANPELEALVAEKLGFAAQRQAPPPPAAPPFVPPTPPPLDLDDPQTRYLYEQQQAINARLAELQGVVVQGAQFNAQQQAATSQSLIATARTTFAKEHELTTAQLDAIEKAAGRLGVLPSLLAGVDPITGSPSIPDPLRAISRALDIAYWQFPELREKEVARINAARKVSNKRKANLQKVSGSSGSVPRRQAPAPMNEAERRKAMVNMVSEMMNGTYTEDN